MEFILGILFAFATIFFVRKVVLSDSVVANLAVQKIVYRQTYIYELTAPFLQNYSAKISMPKTQSFEHEAKNKLRIFIADDKAYWIKNNAFYEANFVDGMVDESTTKVVDTIGMNKVELDKMIFIVQQLTEGMTNDGGNTGN
jgi:hypothetical protein